MHQAKEHTRYCVQIGWDEANVSVAVAAFMLTRGEHWYLSLANKCHCRYLLYEIDG